MRIVHLTPQWSATTGGPSRYVASLQRELRHRGHEVHVVTTDAGAGADLVSGSFPLRDARTVRRLCRLDADIVHVHSSARLLFAALVYRLLRRGARVVFTFHTQPITRQFVAGLNDRRHDYTAVSAPVARFLLSHTDLVTAVSESIISAHNDAYRLGIRRYVRIPSGGDPRALSAAPARSSTERPSEVQGHPVLLSVGVMAWDWKVAGHLVCVRAVDELRRHYPNVMLLIAGDGPHRGVVEREVAARGLRNHVRLLGDVAPHDFLDAADIYVHMAMNEGCSLAIIEAMHAAKPIVAARAGGTPEVLTQGDSAILVEPEPAQLAGAVEMLMTDAAYRARLGARALEVALQQYAWPVVAEQYATLYESLLLSSYTER